MSVKGKIFHANVLSPTFHLHRFSSTSWRFAWLVRWRIFLISSRFDLFFYLYSFLLTLSAISNYTSKNCMNGIKMHNFECAQIKKNYLLTKIFVNDYLKICFVIKTRVLIPIHEFLYRSWIYIMKSYKPPWVKGTSD